MKKQFLFIIMLLLWAGVPFTFSQNNITGIIKTENGLPLPDAVVQTMRPADSSLLKLTIARNDGAFTVAATSFPVLLRVSAVNHLTVIRRIENSETTGLQILLKTAVQQLKEVQVTASRPLIQFLGDRTIVNIDAAPSSAGNTMLEVIEKMPGVQVDQDGNISINGKTGSVVLIDGRESFLTGLQLLNLLRNMPAANTDQLEIISNPSARYDASFTGGILNIKTKKGLTEGFNGSVSLGEGVSVFDDVDGSIKAYPLSRNNISWNYRKTRFNFYGNAGFKHEYFFENFKTNRYFHAVQDNTAAGSYFSQSYIKAPDNNSYELRTGLDIVLSSNSVLGILINNNYSAYSSIGGAYSYLANPLGKINYFMQSSIIIPEAKDFTGNYNLNYKYAHPKKNADLSLDLSRLTSTSNSFTNNETYFTDTLANVLHAPIFRHQDSRSHFTGWVFKTDLLLKKFSGFKLETGYKYSFIETVNDPLFLWKQGGNYEIDKVRTTYFRYSDAIHAGYLILSRNVKKLEVQFGLRLESAAGKGYQRVNDSSFLRNWFNLFPSFYVKYNASVKYQLILNYTSRIIRPTAKHLSPFIYMTDSLYSNTGNPFIQPQFSHAVELRHIINNRVSITTSYQNTRDMILTAVYQDPVYKTTKTSSHNLSRFELLTVTVSVPVKPASYWQANITAAIGLTHAHGLLFQLPVKQSIYFATTLMTNNFTLSETWSADLNFSYNSPQFAGLATLFRPISYNAGIRKKTKDNLGSITLSMQNPFTIQRFRMEANYANTEYDSRFSLVRQHFVLTYTLRFGKQTVVQQRTRKNASEEEQGRL
jgi:iron complex outermembrane receptor protein